ncbi:N-acetylneuraminate 9-O-acetyltransferase [Condylostylus longicornis]|uniref:N-acetylneuraminate 9-O-acetyltransferase n=1 Tax=Condylostylus longicornis TaxID=2530218 RepID=UPI00244DE515|nr:N-acetylneuraminate 9-O-acetyltransferase [Condylostylus longicornis]
MEEKYNAENIIKQFNSANAKKIALVVVCGFIIYHGILHIKYGSDSCKWLLAKGRYKGNKEWQPYGCMMHKYSQMDTRKCFRYLAFYGNKNHFIFIGDIRMKMLFQSFINHLHPHEDNENNSVLMSQTKENSDFIDYKLKLRAVYIYADHVSKELIGELEKFQKDSEPSFGSGSTFIIGFTNSAFLSGNVTEKTLIDYSTNLEQLIETFKIIAMKKSKILWKLQDHVLEEKLPDEWKNVVNEDIDKFNKVAKSVFKYSEAKIWESSFQISNGLLDKVIDGYKLDDLALQHDVQIILNMYCNDYMNYNDGSCCSSPEPYTVLQIVSYSVFGVCIVLVLGMLLRRWILTIRGITFYVPLNQAAGDGVTPISGTTDYSTALFAMANLGIILAYFYLCDRTNFFMKENKYYSEFSFWIPVGYVFALGLFFTEDSRFTKVLNRDQTDELRGWMLLVILIYYMTGADRVLSIHMHIKVLISAYIFLAGYSHFTYMWQTGNFGIVRFFQVMFRLNFITVILCFCMNRPYQFYYFVPLLSFWTFLVYFVLCLPPHITAQSVESNSYHYLYLVLKFVCFLSISTILYMSEVFFEKIFVTRPFKAIFVNFDDDIHEWWYQFKLDRYTIVFGMIFASIIHIAQKNNLFDDNNHGNLFSRRISLTVTLAAIIGVGFYTSFSFLCKSQQNCEEIHSYIVFIPILGYIILRSISGILRTRYSTFFAWFGKIWLELFICQYHIWLAADRHGVLVLLPGFPTLNMIITSFIFVCASHEVHRLTQILLPIMVPNDWKLALRNFVFFLLMLVPIGRYDGMF